MSLPEPHARPGRSRIAVRIYLIGLIQIAVVLVGFALISQLTRDPPPAQLQAEEERVLTMIGEQLGDAAALQRSIDAVRQDAGLELTIVDPAGEHVATSVPPGAPPCVERQRPPQRPDWDGPPDPAPERRPPLGQPPPGWLSGGPRATPPHPPPRPTSYWASPLCHTRLVPAPGGGLAQVEVRRMGPTLPSPLHPAVVVLVLVVVGVSSWLLTRSVVRPLRRLTEAANAFGGGDLRARAQLQRRDEVGQVAQAFDQMADRVTELLRAERELVANVSHELRTPLARIRVALDIAAEGDAADVQESLGDIAGDLEELERLVSDVLTAARLELHQDSPRGIPTLRKANVELDELLNSAAVRFRAAHPERPLISEWRALPAIDCDAVLLRRAVDNLLENAHKYSEEPDAPVGLVARVLGDAEVLIEVRDQGIGIAAQDLSGVFRPFFRVDRSRTRATGGLGLGLALAKRIVEAHGGQLELESEQGAGTVVRITLPCGKQQA